MNKKSIIFCLTMMIFSLLASAHDFEVDGIYYNITSSTDLTVEVTYQGDDYIKCERYSGPVAIPENLEYNKKTYRVTGIGEYAFWYNTNLTSITIPESITTIGHASFSNCTGLTSIFIPESVTTIGSFAFDGCRNVSTINIPKGVTKINQSTFNSCGFTNITIPESVTEIVSSAFSFCEKLKAITIPNSVTKIGLYAFMHCYNLENITLSNNITTIGAFAFSDCTSLMSIEIPEGVTEIEQKAFENCTSLTTVILPQSLKSLEIGPFSYCPNLSDVYCYATAVPNTTSDAFEGSNINKSTLHIPTKSREKYLATSPWNSFGSTTSLPKYQISYYVDNNFYYSESIELGQDIILIETPTKDGYTFSGWSEVPETMPAEDVNISGTFIINKYLVTFKIGDEVIVSDSLEYGATIVTPEAPEKEGHTFNGWGEVAENVPANDVTYESGYSVNSYLLTIAIDGEIVESDSIAYGTTITLPEAPAKEGYTFSGWSEVPETMPAKDVTVSGTFIINKYLVTFKIGDELIASDSLEYGATIVAPEAPEKEGHTFNGWGEVAENVPANDVTYEGSYSVNSYNIIYMVDGNKYFQESVKYGTAIELIKEPNKEGYTFSGWSVAPETMPACEITIYGTFTINKYLVTFMIDNTVLVSYSLEYGSKITPPNVPNLEGYTFSGWGEVAETVPAHNVTYEGSYSVNSYNIIYMVDGNKYYQESVKYGTVIELITEPTKEGHTFSGWSEIPETMPAEDITINGTFIINKYLVTFLIDDIVLASDSLEYGSTITLPSTPPYREGYTFSGWGEVAETVPANDVTYSAYYIANVYKVYYFVGSKLVNMVEVTYGEPIPEYIYEPTTEGDEFLGWIGDTYETMPAHDVTYTANIESGINQITIDNGYPNIYDLTGRKVNIDDLEELSEGIYIINGRKVVVKIGM